jgi:hypothetical protein
LKLGANSFLFLSKPANEGGAHRAIGHTLRYSYQLRKDSKRGDNSNWMATEIASEDDWQKSNSYLAARIAASNTERPVKIYTVDSLVDFVRKPYFRVISAQTIDRNLEIKFDSQHSDVDDPKVWVQNGTLILDPARHFIVKSTNLNCRVKEDVHRVSKTITVADKPGEMPIITEYEQRISRPGTPDYITKLKYQFTQNAPAPPESEFRLTTFGLPEPKNASQNYGYLGWWLAGAAGLFGVGYLLRRLVRPTQYQPQKENSK